MNWQHFRTLVWLRGRLFRNWMRGTGKLNALLTKILIVVAGLASVGMFFMALGLGAWLLPRATPDHLLFLWTGVIAVFLFFWVLGVMTELQRSEVLSIEKLLHFPISPSSAFLVNYLSSLVCLALILFLPAMVGLAIASVIALGPWMLVTLPLLAGFVLLVTAVTYQFRGWLATLIVNKRRRRTILATIPFVIIVGTQLPNLFNLGFQQNLRNRANEIDAALQKNSLEIEQLKADLKSHKITAAEYRQRLEAIGAQLKHVDLAPNFKRVADWVSIVDLVVPPGWLAYGASRAAEHQIWPGVCGAAFLCLIGGASLRRSYRTTLRFYLGEYRSGQVTAAPLPADGRGARSSVDSPETHERTAPAGEQPIPSLVARNLPWVPEPAAATALATLRSLLRAPEVKMALLTPLMFGGVMMTVRLAGRNAAAVPQGIRAVLALGIVITVVVSLSQLFQNQFGFDRSAFRVFVLPRPRARQILLGKNLALAPFVLGSGVIFLGLLEFLFPLGPMDLLATVIELVTAYLIVCLSGNQMSILLPAAARSGSMRASSTRPLHIVARLFAMLGMMVAFVPLTIPLGIDYVVQQFAPQVPGSPRI